MTSGNRIAMLVGAGLAVDAGLPTSVALAQKLKAALQEEVRTAGGSRTNGLVALHLAVLNLLNGGIRFQLGVLNRNPDDAVNIEQVAVAALELVHRFESPLAPYASGWHARIAELERDEPSLLSSFVEGIYQRLDAWLQYAKVTDVSYIARLFDVVAHDGVSMDLFSLNYDLCIEAALAEIAKRSFRNGFTETGWDASEFERAESVHLYKLHGSLDWVDDEAYGLCALRHPRHRDAEDIAPQRPLLIFGTSHKLTAREPFLTLAYHFLRRVMDTPLLVVIGYSFGDDYVNEIIDQGIRSNPRLRVLVISPSAAERLQTRPLLKGTPRVRVIAKKAREVLDSGEMLLEIRALLKQRDEELPF